VLSADLCRSPKSPSSISSPTSVSSDEPVLDSSPEGSSKETKGLSAPSSPTADCITSPILATTASCKGEVRVGSFSAFHLLADIVRSSEGL